MLNSFALHKKRFFALILLITMVTQTSVWALAGAANYAEMATALATVPFEISANVYKQKNDDKKAAILNATADAISITNKLLFAANSRSLNTALVANYAYLMHDLIKLTRHSRDIFLSYMHPEQLTSAKAENITLDDFDFSDDIDSADGDASSVATDVVSNERINALAAACQMYVLPSLKGLTACALACLQNGVTRYSGSKAQNMVASAHSLIRISEEFLALKVGSAYKKMLAAALCANAVWLIYELTNYSLSSEWNQYAVRPIPLPETMGEADSCIICMNNGDGRLVRFAACAHPADSCLGCVRDRVDHVWNANRQNIDQVPCNVAGCVHHMTRGEFAFVVNGDAARMALFDNRSDTR